MVRQQRSRQRLNELRADGAGLDSAASAAWRRPDYKNVICRTAKISALSVYFMAKLGGCGHGEGTEAPERTQH
jgi:hypothetical protein